jgi:hypothetical protein
MKTQLSVILALCAAAVLPAGAQPAPAASQKIRFVYLSKFPDTPEKLLIRSNKGIVDVEISSRSPRDYVEVAGGAVLIGTPGTDKDQPIVPVATGAAPAGAAALTALLTPKADGRTYQVSFLDESKFKPGSVYYLNNTAAPVAVTMGGDKFLVAGHKRLLHNAKSADGGRNGYASFQTAVRMPDNTTKAVLIAESTWNISPERAEICVFYHDQTRNRTGMRGISVYFPAARELAAGASGSRPAGG